jgi:hypothetical protein
VVWQSKLSKRAKLWIVAGVVLLLAAGGVSWLIASPSIHHLKQTAAQREAERQAAFIKRETARLIAEQRLQRGAGASTSESPAELVADLRAAISADARARVAAHTFRSPIQETECVPVKHGPFVPNAARGGYECIAVTSRIAKGVQAGGKIGYPFWAIVDFRRHTFAWCKINPQAGEHAGLSAEPVVKLPKGCDLQV